MQRPLGVTILAVLAAIGGVLGFLGGLALFAISSAVSFAIPGISGLTSIIAIVIIVQSVILIAFAYGAWGLKPWAWTLGIIGAVLGIVTSLAQLGGVNAASILVDVVIYAIILWYLWQPSIRRAFGQHV
ncbi:MAG: hypothetical protein ABSA21_01040 [Candidatus Limnocylindrales bacterium]